MINLTTLQGMYYYINTFKKGTEKYDMLQGLKKTLNEYKHRNKSNFYIIFEEDKQLQIISHSIYTYKFSELVQSFNNCVYIDDVGIHLKEGNNITTYRKLLYNDILKHLFSNLDEKENFELVYESEEMQDGDFNIRFTTYQNKAKKPL